MGHQRAEDLHLQRPVRHAHLPHHADRPDAAQAQGHDHVPGADQLARFERQPLPTIGDETTNVSFYSDIRLPDRYRIGEVNNGWSTLHGPLDAEHHLDGPASKLEEIGPGAGIVRHLAESVDVALDWAKDAPDGNGPMIDDKAFLAGIGHLLTEMEASACTPTAMGKIKGSDTVRLGFEQLIDLVGPAATIPHGAEGALGDGIIEYGHRVAQHSAVPAARSRCSGPSSPSTTWACPARITPAARCS